MLPVAEIIDNALDSAVAVENAHGPLPGALKDEEDVPTRLNPGHLSHLQQATKELPVLHGGMGIPKAHVLEAMRHSIAKGTIASEVRQTYERALAESGTIAEAQDAVYTHICRLIGEYYGLAGMRLLIAPAAPQPGETPQ